MYVHVCGRTETSDGEIRRVEHRFRHGWWRRALDGARQRLPEAVYGGRGLGPLATSAGLIIKPNQAPESEFVRSDPRNHPIVVHRPRRGIAVSHCPTRFVCSRKRVSASLTSPRSVPPCWIHAESLNITAAAA